MLTLIEHLEQDFEPDVIRDRVRWARKPAEWVSEVDTLKRFAQHRPKFVRAQLKAYFNLSDEEMAAYELQATTEAP